eukprot:TRINITY_DN57230_c0_g1_i1.p1 TRINITY_DN57230_c0_g1~~TRINITY_DN57230_c0_g1_i1.p1  ORF type:complete len:226 (-),score=41.17 TRINITY_DN57230_c0_g1_i1:94-771(-)
MACRRQGEVTSKLIVSAVCDGVVSLLTEDFQAVQMPACMLPGNVQVGNVVRCSLSRRMASESRRRRRVLALQDRVETFLRARLPASSSSSSERSESSSTPSGSLEPPSRCLEDFESNYDDGATSYAVDSEPPAESAREVREVEVQTTFEAECQTDLDFDPEADVALNTLFAAPGSLGALNARRHIQRRPTLSEPDLVTEAASSTDDPALAASIARSSIRPASDAG